MKSEKILHPVRPQTAIELAYRRRLLKLIDEMHDSVVYWLKSAYRRNPAAIVELIAQDASPIRNLKTAVRRLAKRWLKNFDKASQDLAKYFATSVQNRSDTALKLILKRGGFSVKFNMGKAAQETLQSIVEENVALIKSIPSQYFTQIEGMVMRSVQAGRDLSTLAKDLEKQFGVTKRRAALIARDQNNKATGAIQRVRQLELGIKEAIWMHSGGGKHPRPTHVKAGKDQVRYSVDTGWFDPHERKYILPGELINCRCVSRPVIPGFA